jgi:hypothetical protein
MGIDPQRLASMPSQEAAALRRAGFDGTNG